MHVAKRRSARVWLAVAAGSCLVVAAAFAFDLVGGGPNLMLLPFMVGAVVATIVGLNDLMQSTWSDPDRQP